MSSSSTPNAPVTPILEAKVLSKTYLMYASETKRLIAMITGRSDKTPSHQALKDIDLTIYPGECVGIVGKNGAGKSTLLQLICGTLQPTSGTVAVKGRISPLLELASGFSPDFTGKENVYQKSAILGLTRKQTESRFEQIAQFADIGDFIDRPVRIYSSGMLARLAFSVAIHVDADLLVLDEILAVGDAAFQRKCHAKIAQLKEAGTAILLVSHSTGAITSACSRAILIDSGQCLLAADSKTVVSWYHRLMDVSPKDQAQVRQEILQLNNLSPTETSTSNSLSQISENPSQPPLQAKPKAEFNPAFISKSLIEWDQRGAQIKNVRIEDQSDKQVNMLIRQQPYQLVFEVTFDRDTPYARFGMLIRNTEGLDIYGCSSAPHAKGYGPIAAGQTLTIRFKFKTALARSAYFCCAGVLAPESDSHHAEEIYLHRVFDAAVFRVLASKSPITAGFTDLGEYHEDNPYGQDLVTIKPANITEPKPHSTPQ